MNILETANEITFVRSEEKERKYGPFKEGMEKAAKIASEMCNKDITAIDITKCLIALKLSRESYEHKYDNLLDILSYTAILNKLNGENIIHQIKLPSKKIFESKQKMEEYRKLKEMKLQWREDKKGHEVKVSVILDHKNLVR
jgi:hypothetical protein